MTLSDRSFILELSKMR